MYTNLIFVDKTVRAAVVSPMHFTHYTPRQVPLDLTSNKITLQIFSFKIANIDLDLQWPLLEWPLKVYGLVAARDNVDRRRNILFHRRRDNFQEITQEVSACCILLAFLLSPLCLHACLLIC